MRADAGFHADNADHPPGRHVGDAGPSDDRRHVMLAVALEWNAAQNNHFVVAASASSRVGLFKVTPASGLIRVIMFIAGVSLSV